MIKNANEITNGIPIPPFLMIAPNDAPIRKNMNTETGNENLLKNSI